MKIKAEPPRSILKTAAVTIDVLPTPENEKRNPFVRRPTPRMIVTRASQSPSDTLEVPAFDRSEWSDTTPSPLPPQAKRKNKFIEWVCVKILRRSPREAR